MLSGILDDWPHVAMTWFSPPSTSTVATYILCMNALAATYLRLVITCPPKKGPIKVSSGVMNGM
ncbi:hypothetical protein RSAG8_00957, partial [Rhizoctonia solani AG-8 WAC10335]